MNQYKGYDHYSIVSGGINVDFKHVLEVGMLDFLVGKMVGEVQTSRINSFITCTC